MNYAIKGGNLPYVEVTLENGESISCQNGGMCWKSPNLEMTTKSGGIGKMFSKAFSGESIFSNVYTAKGGPGVIGIASSFPGNIICVDVTPDNPIICQKSAYLCSTPGVELSVYFQKKLGAGFFGGEGFIMQKLSGTGKVFLEIDGAAETKTLAPGEQLIIDTGYLAVMSATCSMDLKTVGGLKNSFLGGEGLFNTVVTGPGKVVLQSMPVSRLAALLSIASSSN